MAHSACLCHLLLWVYYWHVKVKTLNIRWPGFFSCISKKKHCLIFRSIRYISGYFGDNPPISWWWWWRWWFHKSSIFGVLQTLFRTAYTHWPMALFHCMVRHGTVRFGTVRYGSLLGGFPLGTVPGTWYFFSTTSAEVPSDPYRYQNVTCKLCWSLIGPERIVIVNELATWDPLDLNQHSQRRSGRTFLHQPQIICFIVCWGSSDVPLVDSRGADPVRPWWCDAEGKSLMYIYILLNLLYFQSMSSVYIFTSVSVFCFN